MDNKPIVNQEVVSRSPAERNLVINLDPISELDIWTDHGRPMLEKAERIRLLATKLEHLADEFENVGYELLEADEPSRADFSSDREFEETLEEFGVSLSSSLASAFKKIRDIVESIESSVNGEIVS